MLKKCKDDEILNPISKRCVKKNGAIGKKILAAAAVAEQQPIPNNKNNNNIEKKCKPDQILNPVSKRCVSRTGAIGRKLVEEEKKIRKNNVKANSQKPQNNIMFKSIVYLRKPRGSVTLKITILAQVSGKHQVLIEEGRDGLYTNKKTILSFVIQDVVSNGLREIEKYINKGYEQIKAEGLDIDKYEDYIKTHFVCKITDAPAHPKKNTAVVDINKCVNDSTLLMFEPLTDIDPKLIISMSDGYCFEVNELASSIISQGKFVNPLTAKQFQEADLTLLLKHKKLEKENKDKLKELVGRTQQKATDIVKLYQQSPQLVKDVLKLILYVGTLCLTDYTDTFVDSQVALGIMSEVFSTKLGVYSKILQNLVAPGFQVDMDWVLNNYNQVCIHGIGFRICELALYNIFMLGCQEEVIPNKLYHVSEMADGTPYALLLASVMKPAYDIYVYAHLVKDAKVQKSDIFKQLFARIGRINYDKSMLRFDYELYVRFGTHMVSSQQIAKYAEESLISYLAEHAVIEYKEKEHNIKHMLKIIESLSAKL